MRPLTPHGRGIGLRPELVADLCAGSPLPGLEFLELAPENWMGIGGRKRDQLDQIAARYPLVAHGLSLSIADTEPLNIPFVREVARFLDDYAITLYSDHLSLSRDGAGYLYDLLPVPRRRENIDHIAGRIQRVQDITGRRLVLENISHYHHYDGQMAEGEFLAELAGRSGCGLLLDINNAYVNGLNHRDDPLALVRQLPSSAIAYYHIAGHLDLRGGAATGDCLPGGSPMADGPMADGPMADGLVLDTHGTPVVAEVVRLGQAAWACHGPRPLLLERDNFVPPLPALVAEVGAIHRALVEGGGYVVAA